MTQQLVLLVLAAAACVALLVWLLLRLRITPEERERRRRLQVHRTGRMADGMLIDVGDDTLHFQYSVRGVEYTACQDVSLLAGRLPDDRYRLIGPVTLKYSPGNPANSIVVCEEWSGLRIRDRALAANQTTAS